MKSLHTLPNGLKVLVIENQSQESVSLSLMGKAGSMYESPSEIGAAHFLEHVVFDATENYPNETALTGLIEGTGGIRGGSTNKETVHYWVKVLPQFLEEAFIYLSEITLRPSLLEKDIEKHKGIIEQEIERFKADPEKFISRIAFSILFPNQTIGGFTTGEVADIKKISKETLTDFLQKHYIASNFIIVVCGKCSESEVISLTEKYFNQMNQGISINVPVIPQLEKAIVIDNRAGLKQSAIQMSYHGFSQESPESITSEFISSLLSRGKISRLRRKIRDKLALAYVISSFHYTGVQLGIFGIYAAVAEKNLGLFKSAIDEELEALMNKPVEQAEFDRALALIKSNYLFNFENNENMAEFYARRHLNQTTIQDHNDMIAYISKLTPDDISSTAKKLFSQGPKISVVGENVTPESLT